MAGKETMSKKKSPQPFAAPSGSEDFRTRWEKRAQFNESAELAAKGKTPRGRCYHRGYAAAIRAMLADLPNTEESGK